MDARHRVAAWAGPIGLRLATDSDRAQLARLAELDTRPLPPGPHLVAERDGKIQAALSISSQELIADPFSRTAELCEVLRCLAGGLRTAPRDRRDRLPVRPRLVNA